MSDGQTNISLVFRGFLSFPWLSLVFSIFLLATAHTHTLGLRHPGSTFRDRGYRREENDAVMYVTRCTSPTILTWKEMTHGQTACDKMTKLDTGINHPSSRSFIKAVDSHVPRFGKTPGRTLPSHFTGRKLLSNTTLRMGYSSCALRQLLRRLTLATFTP